MKLEKLLENLLKNDNYNLSGLKIDKIKENDKIYIVYFSQEIENIGRQLNYIIDKKTGKTRILFLPNVDNFKLLDEFENNNFVNIPKKFRGKVF